MTLSTSSNYVNAMGTSWEPYDSKTKKKNDELGRDAFLTMMVAQLQNQDPLNPLEGSEFSSQLAQFSQLEQLLNLNKTMSDMKTSFDGRSDKDITSYIGKEVVGDVDSMSVKNGTASAGYYNLSKPGEVRIEVYDAKGKVVKTIFPGQKNKGSHSLFWDGRDNQGQQVPDGTYKYSVMADMGSGFEQIPTTVTGTVDGIVYGGDKPFLVVDGVWVNPESLLQVREASSGSRNSIIDYLGKNVTSSSPLIHVDKGTVAGSSLSFNLEKQDSVIVGIYDLAGNLIRTMGVPAAGTKKGENSIAWDGLDNDGKKAANGVYSYKVTTSTGNAVIAVTDRVSGIKTVGGSQFLVLDSSGRFALTSSITDINALN